MGAKANLRTKRSLWSRIDKKDLIIPGIAFAIMVVFKLIFVIWQRTMPIITDEFSYAYYGRVISDFEMYRGYQYPLLYPLVMAQAYWVNFGHLYKMMELLNVLWSSLTVVFTYYIARCFMDYRKSMIPLAFSMVMPFQLAFPMMILSENIYFPLLLLTILVIVADTKKHPWFEAFFYGVLLGALYLTRFVTLVMLPVFVLAFVMKKINQKTKLKIAAGQFLLMAVSAVATYMPFFLNQLAKGYPVKYLLGFSIAQQTNPAQLTIKRLLMVALLYVCYMVIAALPVIPGIIRSFFAIEFKNITGKFNRLWILAWGLFGASFVAVVRHSWRAKYNFSNRYPMKFERIKGRYLMYFPLIFAILAAVVIFQKRTKIKNKFLNIILCYILPVFLFIMSYLIYTKGFIFGFDAVTLNGNVEAIDGYKAIGNGMLYVIPSLIFMLVVQIISDYGNRIRNLFSDRIPKIKYLPVVMAMCFVLCESAGVSNAWGHVVEQQKENQNTKVQYAKTLTDLLGKLPPSYHTRAYIYSEVYAYKAFTEKAVNYILDKKVVYKYETKLPKDDTVYIYTRHPEKYEAYFIEEMGKINYEDENLSVHASVIRIQKEGLKLVEYFLDE